MRDQLIEHLEDLLARIQKDLESWRGVLDTAGGSNDVWLEGRSQEKITALLKQEEDIKKKLTYWKQ